MSPGADAATRPDPGPSGRSTETAAVEVAVPIGVSVGVGNVSVFCSTGFTPGRPGLPERRGRRGRRPRSGPTEVRFRAEHRLAGPLHRVLAVLGDPHFYLELDLPDLSRPELLEEQRDGEAVLLRLRYEFLGGLDPIAQRLIGPGRLAWVQEVRIDSGASTGGLRFEAERDPGRLHGDARFVLTEAAGVTTRELDGELVVRVPGVGRMAERRIVPGILGRLDIEAEAVDERLRSTG